MHVRTYLIVTLLLVGFAQASNAQNATTSRELSVTGFEQLQVVGSFAVHVRKGDAFMVKVSGTPENIDNVISEVKSNELYIGFKDSKARLLKQKTRIDIEMPTLRAVRFSGAVEPVIHAGFTPGNFVAYVGGATHATISIDAKETYLDLSGTASLKIDGKTDVLKINATGTAGVDAYEFLAREATLDASGTAGVRVNVRESIKATAAGASSIRYKGDAKLATANSARLSSIKKTE